MFERRESKFILLSIIFNRDFFPNERKDERSVNSYRLYPFVKINIYTIRHGEYRYKLIVIGVQAR